MNKKLLYSVGTLLLAIAFVCGSMEAMNSLLGMKENKLLSAGGVVVVAPPVKNWHEAMEEDEVELERNIDSANNLLSLEQVGMVLDSYYNNDIAVSHLPVEGQITADQAELACRSWLEAMDISTLYGGFIRGDVYYSESGQVRGEATEKLYTWVSSSYYNNKEYDNEKLDPYYSFWEVSIENDSVDIVMLVNAMTGTVWRANIMFYDVEYFDTENELNKLERFVKLAKIADDISLRTVNTVENLDIGYGYVLASLGDSDVYAVAEVYGGSDSSILNNDIEIKSDGFRMNIDEEYADSAVIEDEEEALTISFSLQL